MSFEVEVLRQRPLKMPAQNPWAAAARAWRIRGKPAARWETRRRCSQSTAAGCRLVCSKTAGELDCSPH